MNDLNRWNCAKEALEHKQLPYELSLYCHNQLFADAELQTVPYSTSTTSPTKLKWNSLVQIARIILQSRKEAEAERKRIEENQKRCLENPELCTDTIELFFDQDHTSKTFTVGDKTVTLNAKPPVYEYIPTFIARIPQGIVQQQPENNVEKVQKELKQAIEGGYNWHSNSKSDIEALNAIFPVNAIGRIYTEPAPCQKYEYNKVEKDILPVYNNCNEEEEEPIPCVQPDYIEIYLCGITVHEYPGITVHEYLVTEIANNACIHTANIKTPEQMLQFFNFQESPAAETIEIIHSMFTHGTIPSCVVVYDIPCQVWEKQCTVQWDHDEFTLTNLPTLCQRYKLIEASKKELPVYEATIASNDEANPVQ